MFTTTNPNNLIRVWFKTTDCSAPLAAFWCNASADVAKKPTSSHFGSPDNVPADLFLYERVW